jgi:predicted DNA-binding transcriptional regulator YafY
MAEGWMVSGWCDLRADFRTWRFDRIIDLTPTADRFPDDPGKNLAAFLAREACESAAP